MLQTLFFLTRAQFQMTRNTIWHGGWSRRIGTFAMLVLMGFAVVGIFNISSFVVQALNSAAFAEFLSDVGDVAPDLPTDLAPYLLALPSAILFTTFLMLVLTSVGSLLNTLYLSKDLPLLLVAPVPLRTIFTVKFFQGLQSQYLLIAGFIAPALVGFGQGMGYGAAYLLAALLILLLLPLIPAGIGALVVMALVRILPAERVQTLISLLGGFVGLGFYVSSQIALRPGNPTITADRLNLLLASNLPWLPSAWAAQMLVAMGAGDLLVALAYGSLFAGVTLVAFTLCLLGAERLYYHGWSNLVDQPQQARTPRAKRRMLPGDLIAWFSDTIPGLAAPVRALIAKDLRLVTRDLSNLQLLIFPITMAFLWTFQITRNAPRTVELDQMTSALQTFSSLAIVLFICLSLASTLAGGSISREGRTYWLLQVTPLSPLQIFIAKALVAYLPYPLLGTPILLLMALIAQLSPLVVLQQWLLLLLVGLGATAIATSLGASFVRLNWENPNQQRPWQVGCLSSLLYPIYFFISISPVVGGTLISASMPNSALSGAIIGAGWTISLLITSLVIWSATLLGMRGIARIES
jgi:hypothetical protein